MPGLAEIIAFLWLMGFTFVAITGYLSGDLSLSAVGIAALLLAVVFAKDFLGGVIFGIVTVTGPPIQRLLLEFGIYTDSLVAGMIGWVIVAVVFLELLDVLDPRPFVSKTSQASPAGETSDERSRSARPDPEQYDDLPENLTRVIDDVVERIDEINREHIDDQRGYPTQKTAYRRTLTETGRIADENAVRALGDRVVAHIRIEQSRPKNRVVREWGNEICTDRGYDVPSHSYLSV